MINVDTRPELGGVKWNAVHLPIVYSLSNDYFPTNTSDTSQTISSSADDSGLLQLNLSGSLGTFEALDYVYIAGSDIPDGVYKILTKGSSSQITINYPYTSITTPGSIVLYKNNYHIIVRVYCGINAAHTYGAIVPYALISTLKFIPDADNINKFSINEIVKGQLNISNTLTSPALPNNLEFWRQFYIEYAESYDQSDGTTVSTFTSTYTSDASNLEGIATQSKLPFKNTYAGWMTEYVNASRKFMTLFEYLYLYPGNYMDVSFIISEGLTNVSFYTETYLNGALQNTYVNALTVTNNYGVFRKQLTQIGNEDSQNIYLAGVATLLAPSSFTDGTNPYSSKSATAFSKGLMTTGVVYSAYQPANISEGQTPASIDTTLFISPGLGGTILVTIAFYDVLGGTLLTSDTSIANGTKTFSFATLSADAGIMVVSAVASGPPGTYNVGITLEDIGQTLGASLLSETKTIYIDQECSSQQLNLCWLNYLGGFDWNVFTAQKEYGINIKDSGETKINLLPNWPSSYYSTADTIRKQTFIESNQQILVRSQYLTLAQKQAISYIKTSPLVQIVTSTSDRRTVIVDKDSFTIYDEGDKTYSIEFTISYTDDIPSQSL